jgi:hypothetical protein
MSLYIVDGNNLKGYLLGSNQLRSAEDSELIGWLRRRQAERRRKRGKGDRIIVFFDAGAGDRRPTGDGTLMVRVAPPGITADEAIVRELTRLPAAKGKREATLITSDRALQEQARALGAQVWDCDRFAPKPAAPVPSLVDTLEKDRAARELGRSVDALFMPGQERRARPIVQPRRARLSPRKVSQMRDPARLSALLNDGDRTVRRRAALALARVGTEQGRKLLEHALVADPVPSVRAAAAVALGQMGEDRSLDALRKAAGDPFSLVRASVATVLARSNDPRAAAILQSLTHDPRRRVRRAAMC